MLSPKKRPPRPIKTPALKINLSSELQKAAREKFVDSVNRDKFNGKRSLSKVIAALLQIALEHSDKFDPDRVTDSESLKNEMARTLTAAPLQKP